MRIKHRLSFLYDHDVASNPILLSSRFSLMCGIANSCVNMNTKEVKKNLTNYFFHLDKIRNNAPPQL